MRIKIASAGGPVLRNAARPLRPEEIGSDRIRELIGPGCVAIVPRARTVRVRALNEAGEPVQIEAGGWYARILQHEINHLKGTLYIDRMGSRSFSSIDHCNRHWKSKSTAELL